MILDYEICGNDIAICEYAITNKRDIQQLGLSEICLLEPIYFSLRNKRIRFKVTPMAFATAMTISPFTIP
jgi:hypothetical protein